MVGEGVRSYDAGEIWYIMDRQYNIPITKIDVSILETLNIEKYTHFIFPSFTGDLSDKTIHKIKSWIEKEYINTLQRSNKMGQKESIS